MEDSLEALAMAGSRSLAALKVHLGVGWVRRRTGGCRRVNRIVQWTAPGVHSSVGDRLQALYPVVSSKGPREDQLVAFVAVGAVRQLEEP